MFKLFSLASLLALALTAPAFVAGCTTDQDPNIGSNVAPLTDKDIADPPPKLDGSPTNVSDRRVCWQNTRRWGYEAGNKECVYWWCCDETPISTDGEVKYSNCKYDKDENAACRAYCADLRC